MACASMDCLSRSIRSGVEAAAPAKTCPAQANAISRRATSCPEVHCGPRYGGLASGKCFEILPESGWVAFIPAQYIRPPQRESPAKAGRLPHELDVLHRRSPHGDFGAAPLVLRPVRQRPVHRKPQVDRLASKKAHLSTDNFVRLRQRGCLPCLSHHSHQVLGRRDCKQPRFPVL